MKLEINKNKNFFCKDKTNGEFTFDMLVNNEVTFKFYNPKISLLQTIVRNGTTQSWTDSNWYLLILTVLESV